MVETYSAGRLANSEILGHGDAKGRSKEGSRLHLGSMLPGLGELRERVQWNAERVMPNRPEVGEE